MKIYISGSFESRVRLREMANLLWAQGHVITSSWLDEGNIPLYMGHKNFYKKLGMKDVAEVIAADVLISDELDPSTSGGRYIELGVALGRFQHMQIWLVGPGKSPFHELVDAQFDTWEGLMLFVMTLRGER